jgi:hypothetical protein
MALSGEATPEWEGDGDGRIFDFRFGLGERGKESRIQNPEFRMGWATTAFIREGPFPVACERCNVSFDLVSLQFSA